MTNKPTAKVKYGLRVAVLAGVITVTGGITTGLGHPINSLAGPMDTTCCGVPSVVRQVQPTG